MLPSGHLKTDSEESLTNHNRHGDNPLSCYMKTTDRLSFLRLSFYYSLRLRLDCYISRTEGGHTISVFNEKYIFRK
jgi:hypothetical protein